MSDLRTLCDEVVSIVTSMLREKNAAYGDSARNPMRVYSTSSVQEQLLVRIDDKLSRIKRGKCVDEDPELDLLGYLIILGMGDGPFEGELDVARRILGEDLDRVLKSLDHVRDRMLLSTVYNHVAVQLDSCLAKRNTDAVPLLVIRRALAMAARRGVEV